MSNRIIGGLVAFHLAVAAMIGLTTTQAHANPAPCVTAHTHLHSETAALCREDGWTVRAHLVINPRNIVRWTSFPKCRQEDSPNCRWNARTMGNGIGDSFVIKGHRDARYRVWWVDGFNLR